MEKKDDDEEEDCLLDAFGYLRIVLRGAAIRCKASCGNCYAPPT